jgi:membrane-anchored glycerophosphoryl diester phosphodiesterase (GDPDase)
VILVASLVIGLLASGGGAGAAVGGGFLAVFLALGVMVFIGVRFSLALPATFAERRIRIRESWRLTKGRFWPLLGCYLLAVILALVIYLLAMMIYLAIAAVVGGGIEGATSVFRPNYSSFGELYSAAMIVYVLVTAVVSAVTTAITTAPAAAAYRDIAGYGQDAAEVFS